MIWITTNFDSVEAAPSRPENWDCVTQINRYQYDFSRSGIDVFKSLKEPIRLVLSSFPQPVVCDSMPREIAAAVRRMDGAFFDQSDAFGLPVFETEEGSVLTWLVENARGRVRFTAQTREQIVGGGFWMTSKVAFTNLSDETAFRLIFEQH